MPEANLDDLDQKILRELQKNHRISNVKIAQAVGSTEATVRRRVHRLLDEGVARFIVAVNPIKLGSSVEVFFCLRADLDKLEQVARTLARYEEVSYIGLMTGSFDILVHAQFSSDQAVYDFIRHRIAPIQGVRDSQTLHVLEVMKRAFRWIPIEEQAFRVPPHAEEPKRRSSHP